MTISLSPPQSHRAQAASVSSFRLLAITASCCAFFASLALCAVIYAQWGGSGFVSATGSIRIYRIASLILMGWAALVAGHSYLDQVSRSFRPYLALAAVSSAVGMAVFVTSVSAVTFTLLFPGICLLIGLALVAGLIAQ